MKKLLLIILLSAASTWAQAPAQCKDFTLTATGRTLLLTGNASAFASGNFTYVTGGAPASVAIQIEAGNQGVGRQTPFVKITSVTDTTGADMGSAAGSYRFWWANVTALTANTRITLTACFHASAFSIARFATVPTFPDQAANVLFSGPASGAAAAPTFRALVLADLPVGTADQSLKTNAAGTSLEHVTLAVGTSGTDFAIAHAAGSTTFNLPDASATARGAITTGAQAFAGQKDFDGGLTAGGVTRFEANDSEIIVGSNLSRMRIFSGATPGRVNIGTVTTGGLGVMIHGTGVQTGDLLQLRDSDEATILSRFTAGGAAQLPQKTVAFSGTPTFDASTGNSFRIVLAGNVTDCTISNPLAGQEITLIVKQSAGGSNTFACAALLGLMTISATADKRNAQTFIYDGTDAAWLATSSGVTGM